MSGVGEMRVGVEVVMLSAPRAGVARYLVNMLSWMMRINPGIEFVLYSPGPVELMLPEGRWRLHADRNRQGRVANLWVQCRLPQLLAADRVSIFWGQNHFLPLRLQHHCRRILTVHDITALLFPQTMHPRSRLGAAVFLRKAVKLADRVVAVSKKTASLLELFLGARERVSVIYPGRAEVFQPVERQQAQRAVAARYALPEQFLLTVGTIEPRKNYGLLLRALAEMPDMPLLVLVGQPGWRCESIVSELRAWEKKGRVRILTGVEDEDLRLIYGAAILTVIPSLYEGFGSPVVEAMACGCPVLCSWTASLPEVGGRAARYFRSNDVTDLVGKLKALLASPAVLEQMREDGLKQAQSFSYEQAARQMLDLIQLEKKSLVGQT
ncbi:MAG: glycosyltransferase family 1 protein [candidate division WOR-3 bacterium]